MNHHFIKLGKMVPHSSTLFVCDIQGNIFLKKKKKNHFLKK